MLEPVAVGVVEVAEVEGMDEDVAGGLEEGEESEEAGLFFFGLLFVFFRSNEIFLESFKGRRVVLLLLLLFDFKLAMNCSNEAWVSALNFAC